MADPIPTRGARRDLLEELLAGVRRALAARDEAPGGAWIEEVSRELADGRRAGFYSAPADGPGIAFYAVRGTMAFGHVHVEPGVGAPARAVRLAARLLEALPTTVLAADVGFSGLAEEEELEVVGKLASERPGSRAIPRQAFERALTEKDGEFPAEPPQGTRRVEVRDLTPEAFAALDARAFAGSVDALLVGDSVDDFRRSFEAILGDELGRFLDEASCGVIETEPMRLLGAILTAEKSSRHAVFLDIVVDPERRRRGLGRFLLGWGLRAAWGLGYERVRLWASVENLAALGLYERFGFRPVARAAIYRWDRPASEGQPHRSR